jgi:hypothetical protein
LDRRGNDDPATDERTHRKTADRLRDAEVSDADEAAESDGRPRFYPFPLRSADENDD